MRVFLISILIVLLFSVANVHADDAPVLRIVLFTPSDVDPPKIAEERLTQIIDYTQDYFSKWIKHWGYDCKNPLAVKRDEKGTPEIFYVKGQYTKASGKYDKPGFARQVIAQAAKKYDVQAQGQVWWIFMYKALESGWGRGGGNIKRGGSSTAYLYTNPGDINPGDKLGDGLIKELKLKGCIHELGHALGLPHIGPKDCDNLGNSLMGPTHSGWAKRRDPNEPNVYLSQASAAILSKHFLFTGSDKGRFKETSANLLDLKADYNKNKDTNITITGKVESNIPAQAVIIANESKNMPTEYWRKTFVGGVKSDGSFKVSIDEFPRLQGRFKIAFLLENGALAGNQGKIGLGNGFVQYYRFINGKIKLLQENPK
jgi:hypothetical protein